MKKKIILLTIILIPSLIYFFFELSEVNFKKMAYYGPKKVVQNGDTLYYTLPENALDFGTFFRKFQSDSITELINKLPENQNSFLIIFCDQNQENKLAGILELEKYKKEKLDLIDLKIVQLQDSLPFENDTLFYSNRLIMQFGIQTKSISLVTVNGGQKEFEKLRDLYFVQKPIHVFNYFAVLVDKERHIRGYYDPTFVSEVKRMIEEYKHLVLKDEHAGMQENNKIESK
jgi:hypothetical protein